VRNASCAARKSSCWTAKKRPRQKKSIIWGLTDAPVDENSFSVRGTPNLPHAPLALRNMRRDASRVSRTYAESAAGSELLGDLLFCSMPSVVFAALNYVDGGLHYF
jgi:hypothetical protein